MTDIRFAFETLQHDHDAKTFGFATEGPSLTRQEFAEECDINVLMAYGRCLRPALYSSLRSSPSHPTGVSALRVTIAIANARFARKQWEPRKSGQALMEDPQRWAEPHVLANRRECREPLGLAVGPWEPATEEGKIKRTGVRELADRSAVEKPLSAHWFFRIATTGAR